MNGIGNSYYDANWYLVEVDLATGSVAKIAQLLGVYGMSPSSPSLFFPSLLTITPSSFSCPFPLLLPPSLLPVPFNSPDLLLFTLVAFFLVAGNVADHVNAYYGGGTFNWDSSSRQLYHVFHKSATDGSQLTAAIGTIDVDTGALSLTPFSAALAQVHNLALL